MYGDCQVMSTIGGGTNTVTSDNLFSPSSSPSHHQNPNFNFIPFNTFSSITPKEENNGIMNMMMMMRGKEEMFESGSGSDQAGDPRSDPRSGNELADVSCNDHQELELEQNDDTKQPPAKKKRYHRHTARQIQEMEALFKECPHPDDKQRQRLSQELGLKPRQVKFWFQNKRTQMKAQQDRGENVMLRTENETLKTENYRLQAEIRSLVCPTCGGPAILGDVSFEELRIENARLREELERVCCMVSRFTGRPPLIHPPNLELDMNIYSRNFPEHCCPDMMLLPPDTTSSLFPAAAPESDQNNNNLLLNEEEKTVAMELAISSVTELVKMCTTNEPLWKQQQGWGDETASVDVDEYSRMFSWTPLDQIYKGGKFKMESSRATSVVIMNSITLVDSFLDADKWTEMFSTIIARSKTVQVISSGVSGLSGSLVLMYAELQVQSPLVPTREMYFLRYAEQNAEEGYWVVVDFPIDSFHDRIQPLLPALRRRPSGCLIQDMPNGYSRVTWVEHLEVEEKYVHQIFGPFLDSGLAFGAHRWLAVLQRQCERIASLMARNITDLGVIPSAEARKNVMRLAQRMIRTFCVNISTSCGQSWTALSESADDTVRITTRKISEPAGQHTGVVLCAVSTTWLPYPHQQVFDLLRDEHRRSQLEVLSNGNSLHEVAHIANGSHPGNCISLLRINVASNSSHHVELMLQESCTDSSGSLIVYSMVDVDSIQLAMNGEDPSRIPLLPLGFSIVPSQPINGQDGGISVGGGGGCLLTVGLQVLASTAPTAKLSLSSVTAINNHLCATVNQIAAALTATGNCEDAANGDLSAGAAAEGG